MFTKVDNSTDFNLAWKILSTHHGEVDDFFKFWPPDKNYFFASDKNAFVAYGIRRRVAICLGDPVGSDKSVALLMKEFGGYCVSRNLTIAFIQSTNRCKKADPAGLLRHVLIGADAVINLKRFNSTTVHNKYFRNIVNRFEKHNFSVTTHHPPHSKALVKELCQVSDSWLKLPHRKEWSFLTGSFDIDYLQQMTLHVLRDANGKAQAFVNELPSFKIGVATIDLMRRLNNAPANCMDFLFICLMKDRLAEGYKGFSLGMSPLDGKPYIANRASKAVHRAYRISNKPIV